MRIPRWTIYLAFVLAIAVLVFMNIGSRNSFNALMKNMDSANRYINDLRLITGIGPLGSSHIHADIAVYVEGKKLDMSKTEYQLRAHNVHLEENNGEIIHVHASGIALGHLLNSLEMDLTSECLQLLNGQKLCSDKAKILKIFVNGKENKEYGSYVINDLDKMLISYGSEAGQELQKQLDSITDLAETKAGKEMPLGG